MAWLDLPSTFEVGLDERFLRLGRRLDAVTRQLEKRISQLDAVRSELERRAAENEALRLEAANWRSEHSAVMATKTMRAARLPRALFRRLRDQ